MAISINEINDSASGNNAWLKRLCILLSLPSVALLAVWLWKMPLSGRGGLPIPGELVIDVPQFFQGDPEWGDDHLGKTLGTLATQGCAVSTASMLLGYYGMDIDPKRLNHFLIDHHGYEGKAWLKWESAAEYCPKLVEKAYEDLPSYALIDWNLLRGNPVIVRIRRTDGITHFVLIVGKRGLNYLIRDPAGFGSPNAGTLYPLADLAVPVEALRFYRRLE